MWLTEDDVAPCDAVDDADVSFHMLSHSVRGTKIKNKKTKFAEGPNPEIHKKKRLFLRLFRFLLPYEISWDLGTEFIPL